MVGMIELILYLGVIAGLVITGCTFGLLGAMLGIKLHKQKKFNIPNWRIGAFAGYVVLFLVSGLYFYLTMSYSYISMQQVMSVAFIGLFQGVITMLVSTLLENKKIVNSYYWDFILSYFLSSLVIAILVGLFLFAGMLNPISAGPIYY
jgi:hypothetical protein